MPGTYVASHPTMPSIEPTAQFTTLRPPCSRSTTDNNFTSSTFLDDPHNDPHNGPAVGVITPCFPPPECEPRACPTALDVRSGVSSKSDQQRS
jgi:hypothetical protein